MDGICKLTQWEMRQLMRPIIMSIRMTKGKKVSSHLWGVTHKFQSVLWELITPLPLTPSHYYMGNPANPWPLMD